MRVKYKILAAFTLLTVILLTALCVFIYFYTTAQLKNDFEKRLLNRASTVASILFKLPNNDYSLLSKLDSATNNLLVSENINVYNNRNQRIYRYARSYIDTTAFDADLLNTARIKGFVSKNVNHKQVTASYFQQSGTPVVVVISAIDENGMENLAELKKGLLIAFFAGVIFSLFAGWVFSRQLLTPIVKITSTVSNISSLNIGNRLTESGINDEWNQLTCTFNKLLTRLQESFEIQGRFISNASHELSTPLTSVSNQIDVVLQKQRTNNEYLAVLQSVKADVQHMSALTQQLLQLARTSSGGIILTEPVRIDEIIMELPLLLKKLSGNYVVQNYFDELPDDEQLCLVNGNYELLLSAFKNIAENACKYGTEHTVDISLSFIENNILMLFSNNYDSFKEEEMATIFQPFQRGSNVGNANGYGLGLSLARRIILLHKGEIKAEIIENRKFLVTIILPSAC